MANSALFLSNDANGFTYYDDYLWDQPLLNETSAHGASAAMRQLAGPLPRNGNIIDVGIAVAKAATSASGFVSGTVDLTLRLNSAAVCSTVPSILMAGSAGQAIYTATNNSAGNAVSAVVNTASSRFSAGAVLAYDYNARSVGSAAAGAAGTGFYMYAKVRYDAV